MDCVELYKYIEAKHPDFLKKLNELGVRYIRVTGAEDNPKSAIGRGWKNIFKVNDHESAEVKMKASDYEF